MREMTRQSTKMRYGRKVPPRLVANRELIEARLNKGWSPNDLARHAGIAGNTVRAAELGFYIEPSTQHALATAVSKPLLEIFPLDRQKEFKR